MTTFEVLIFWLATNIECVLCSLILLFIGLVVMAVRLAYKGIE